jgi:two-component system cell cycle response regulator
MLSNVDTLDKSVVDSQPDIIFIGKEMSGHAEMEPLDYFSRLREQFSGPIIMLSADQDIEYIESYVSAGVTDVFSLTEFDQIEQFISNFVSYRNTVRDTNNAKVLLVEDSRSIMSLVTLGFDEKNIEVLAVPTGREALTVLHFEQVDLVITDFMLEGDMTGLSLIRNIRRTSQWYSLPIIAITGFPDAERDKELLRNGVSDVIHKPFDLEVFLIKCQNLILNKRTFESLIEKQDQIRELINSDPTTGLYNRFYMSRYVDQWVRTHQDESLFVLLLNCDEFTVLKHNLGFEDASEVLLKLSELLKLESTKERLLGRLEGDEFIMVLQKVDFEHALQVADMIREKVAQHFQDIGMTMTIGVSGVTDNVDFAAIFEDANQAVMKAKTKGKNQVCIGELLLGRFS